MKKIIKIKISRFNKVCYVFYLKKEYSPRVSPCFVSTISISQFLLTLFVCPTETIGIKVPGEYKQALKHLLCVYSVTQQWLRYTCDLISNFIF